MRSGRSTRVGGNRVRADHSPENRVVLELTVHYSKNFLVRALRQLDREHDAEVLTVVNIRSGDPFNWSSLEECRNCGLPGIDYGQARDCRYPTDGPEGLHAHVYHDRVAFHLDAVDACRDVLNHGVKDTRAVEGAVIGAGIVALAAALCGGKSGVISTSALVGAAGGAALGAQIPARRQKVLEFKDVVARAQSLRFAVA